MVIGYIILAVAIVSSISFVGAATLLFKKSEGIMHLVVSFAAGSLLAVAFLDLIPESINELNINGVFYSVITGFFLFFLLEKFFHWRHCHENECKEHPFTYLSLLGDGVHNFFDGMIISASFMTSISLGFVTSLAVIFHEIPQEFGDFAILLHGGFTRKKAVLWNFLISLTAFIGALLVYFINFNSSIISMLLPFAAGGFIYIAASDLIPEMHKEKRLAKSAAQILFFIAGIAVISLLIKFVA
jgi:zinc and cadmium transporter